MFESVYHDIVPGERIVFDSTLHRGQKLATVSVTTVEFGPVGDGRRADHPHGQRSRRDRSRTRTRMWAAPNTTLSTAVPESPTTGQCVDERAAKANRSLHCPRISKC
ncbi:hypothetical protein Pme01_14400 [Planosporangium mesophilum]|uniref:Uncharacterized protein n=1 Tax=Planosporangium mesophilum TaxID=689768 RepID=A0A8J3X2E9_9ACTN|nr:hypothetical protein Pme01_14400 [Planosporangium mesophilum]